MKKILTTSLFVAGMALNAQAAESLANSMKNASISGQFRLGYVSLSPENMTDTTGAAIGGQIKLVMPEWNNLQFAIAPYFSEKIGFLSGDEEDGELNGDFFDENGDSFAYIAEAYVDYKFKEGFIRVGRQQLETPFINGDDIRMFPNTYAAGWLNMEINEAISLQAGLVKSWAGFGSGADQDKFKEVGDDGAAAFGITYAVNDALGLQGWVYDFDEGYSLVYLDGTYNMGKLQLAAQFASFDEEANSGVDGTAMGLSATYTNGPWSFYVALNNASNDPGKAVAIGLGGGNFFTSMDETNIAGLSDAEAYLLGFEFNLTDNFITAVGVGHFEDDGAINADIDELDVVLGYTISDNLDVEFVHADVENDAAPADPNSNFTRQVIRASYNF
ncbi:MAG: OprD family outer membrane porin [Calditrichaceae bacterium]